MACAAPLAPGSTSVSGDKGNRTDAEGRLSPSTSQSRRKKRTFMSYLAEEHSRGVLSVICANRGCNVYSASPPGTVFPFLFCGLQKKLDKRFTRVETPRNCWIYSVPPTPIFQVMEEEWSPAVTTFPAPPNSTCIEASFPWVSRFIVPQNQILALAFYPFKSMEPGLSADIYFLFPLL